MHDPMLTELHADDIDLPGSRRRGLATLKHFLHYAETGGLNTPRRNRPNADNHFEESVLGKLANHGYIVRRHLSSSGFYIDFAIVDRCYIPFYFTSSSLIPMAPTIFTSIF